MKRTIGIKETTDLMSKNVKTGNATQAVCDDRCLGEKKLLSRFPEVDGMQGIL
jgi:hypothetical protein